MSSTPAPSLAGRFAAAIALTIGFYVLALVLSIGLLALAIVPWFTPAPQNIWLSVTALVLGGSILIAIFPRRLQFTEPGPRITEADEPRLIGLIAEEAEAVGESVPEAVYLTMEINAAVMQRSRTHRVMIVGIPLLQILTERQLRGVIAHEFGHYSGGDTRLGPWIYRTRETIGRTIAQLSDDDVGTEVYVKRADTAARKFPAVLDGVTLASLPEAVERIPDTANTLRGPDDDPQAAMLGVAGVLGDGVLLALHRAGWTVEAPPGQPVWARRGDDVILPHAAVHKLWAEELSAAEWRELVQRFDVGALALGDRVAA